MQAEATDNDKIMWYVILHMTFVFSAVLLGVLDKMSFASHRSADDHTTREELRLFVKARTGIDCSPFRR